MECRFSNQCVNLTAFERTWTCHAQQWPSSTSGNGWVRAGLLVLVSDTLPVNEVGLILLLAQMHSPSPYHTARSRRSYQGVGVNRTNRVHPPSPSLHLNHPHHPEEVTVGLSLVLCSPMTNAIAMGR